MSGGYVLHHEGTWSYYLGHAGGVPHADGEPMTAALRSGWWSTRREDAVLAVVRQKSGTVTCYRLDDPDLASARYPLEVSEEEYDRRRNLDDDERMFELYTAVREPGEAVSEEIAGPWLRLDGEPPPQDGRAWTASLPAELWQRPEYLHLFPGYMTGFRDRMEQVIRSLPGVRFCLKNDRGTGLDVTIEVPFDKPQAEYRPALNRDGSKSRSRRGRTVPVTATRRLALDVPYRIDAASRAAAVAEWERREASIRAAVADASVAACSACMGHGYVISGSEKYEREVRP